MTTRHDDDIPNRSTDNRSTDHRSRSIEHARRRAWLSAAVLLLATLAFGAAARVGWRPAPGPVRVESHGHGVSFTGHLDRTAVMRGGDGLVRMELVMAAEKRAAAQPVRLPTDLVVVLDRSGSMHGQKIADARSAVRQLISQLGPDDRFSLVTFSSGSELTIPLAYATPNAVARWNETVGSIGAGGGTYMGPALDLAFDAIDSSRSAQRVPRSILLSDGLAAESQPELREKALRAARGEYTLSTVGIGSDFDERMMSSLSDAGTGNYYYLADTRNLAEIFSNEFETANETVASGLEIRLEPAAGVSVVEASGYPLERSGGRVLLRPGSLYSGQQRHVWVTLRVPTGAGEDTALGSVALSYTRDGSPNQLTLGELPKIASVEQERDFFANLDVDRWSKSVVVEEYNDLTEEVAGYIRGGRQDEARRAVRQFRARNEALNRVAASPAVAAQLSQTVELEDSITEAFVGADQKKKQNLLGKSLHSQSYDKRREGGRK